MPKAATRKTNSFTSLKLRQRRHRFRNKVKPAPVGTPRNRPSAIGNDTGTTAAPMHRGQTTGARCPMPMGVSADADVPGNH